MATFTNFARLSYQGNTILSNVVTGEVRETLSVSKNALAESYQAGDRITYVVTVINAGSTAVSGLTVTDDLGGYPAGAGTVYPQAFRVESLKYFVDGVLQATPAVVAGPPLVVSGISVPAGGDVALVYETELTAFAPLYPDATITNTVTVSGGELGTPITAVETVTVQSGASLTITKALEPPVVDPSGEITYTFTIRNFGNTPVVATDDVILSDVFDPILAISAVSFNGVALTAPDQYTYDAASGAFATTAGTITVPAATYTTNPDGSIGVVPGTGTLVVVGTI